MSALAEIQDRVQSTTALLEQAERAAARRDAPPSAFANLRSLEKLRQRLEREFDEIALQEEMDIYRYRILNEGRATIIGLTDAWREFQNLLTVVYTSLKHGGSLKTPPTKKSRKSRMKEPQESPAVEAVELGFSYAFPGSVGVTLTLPNRAGLFDDEVIVQATDVIFDAVQAYGNEQKVTELARKLGPAPVEAMYKWAEAHVSHHYGVGIEWQRSEERKRSLLVQFEEMQVLRDDLSRTTIESRLDVTGDLVAVDMDAHTFRMRLDDSTEIEGTFEGAISAKQAAQIPARYECKIIKRTKVIVLDDKEHDTFFLEGLNSLGRFYEA